MIALWLIAVLGQPFYAEESVGYWEDTSVIYAHVESVVRQLPGEYLVTMRPQATLSGPFDPGMEPEIKVRMRTGYSRSDILEPPQSGENVIAVVSRSTRRPEEYGTPNGATFMPIVNGRHRPGILRVKDFSDPMIAATLAVIQERREGHAPPPESLLDKPFSPLGNPWWFPGVPPEKQPKQPPPPPFAPAEAQKPIIPPAKVSEDSDAFWKRHSLLYAQVAKVMPGLPLVGDQERRPLDYLLMLRPKATIAGDFDSTGAPEIRVYFIPKDEIRLSPPRENSMIVVLIDDHAFWTGHVSVQFRPPLLPGHDGAEPVIGYVEVTSFDDPKVEAIHDAITKFRAAAKPVP
jgi:hypothetical protein